MPCGFYWLPCWCRAVLLESLPAKKANVSGSTLVGDARSGVTSDDDARLKELERESRELQRTYEILRKAPV